LTGFTIGKPMKSLLSFLVAACLACAARAQVPVIGHSTGAGVNSFPYTVTAALDANASDIAGTITLQTGVGPAAKAQVVNVNFTTRFATVPHVVLTPYGSQTFGTGAAAALYGPKQVGVYVDQNTLIIYSGTTPLDPATIYQWTYHVIP